MNPETPDQSQTPQASQASQAYQASQASQASTTGPEISKDPRDKLIFELQHKIHGLHTQLSIRELSALCNKHYAVKLEQMLCNTMSDADLDVLWESSVNEAWDKMVSGGVNMKHLRKPGPTRTRTRDGKNV